MLLLAILVLLGILILGPIAATFINYINEN